LRLALAVLLLAVSLAEAGEERKLDLGGGQALRYTLVEPGDQLASASGTAREILRLLAAGEIAQAAAHSNSPTRRAEVLQEFRDRVGEEEFKRVFARFADPQNLLLAEMAIGAHRLLIWYLSEPAEHLAGQFYVEVEGRFVMDDMPNETRTSLRRVLQAYRKAGATASGRTD
jgi:hypothetical protein